MAFTEVGLCEKRWAMEARTLAVIALASVAMEGIRVDHANYFGGCGVGARGVSL
ncbi:MAG: hypothetical protein AAGD07_24410 [Planctomycetota bacterium]